MLTRFNSSSDFVFMAIPHLYPTGYTVVMNCSFNRWSPKAGDTDLRNTQSFEKWYEERTKNLPENHILKKDLDFLEYGCCLIYHSNDLDDAKMIYYVFGDPDEYYVTFWENGKITNENT